MLSLNLSFAMLYQLSPLFFMFPITWINNLFLGHPIKYCDIYNISPITRQIRARGSVVVKALRY